ncbi:winged helix-turn-helix domain-containing protein [Aquipuribacter sp. SD81]|uniref:winged helix-turn-helix domain-containing protein n=1 Tax=Aquipuribacter sp. SD81 TaxID=3127703 RepID=UPI0030158BDB
MHMSATSIQNVVQAAPPLLPLLRSAAQARVMATVLLNPQRDWSVSEIAGAADVSQPTASREVRRLEQAGVVQVHGGRNQRSVRVDSTAVLYPELAGLVLKAFGPQVVLSELLSTVGGIYYAAIFGGWAERYAGTAGPPPTDVDLLVVGRPDTDALADAVTAAGERLGREVAPTLLSPEEWRNDRSGFLDAVRAGARVDVVGADVS